MMVLMVNMKNTLKHKWDISITIMNIRTRLLCVSISDICFTNFISVKTFFVFLLKGYLLLFFIGAFKPEAHGPQWLT